MCVARLLLLMDLRTRYIHVCSGGNAGSRKKGKGTKQRYRSGKVAGSRKAK